MRAVIDNRYYILPDPSPHPGRVLIRTSISASEAVTAPRMRLATSVLKLMKERASRVPGIIKHDGLAFLLGKTSHLIRREIHRLDAQAASFVGLVVEDRSTERRLRTGQRVAGASVTYPPDTELVLARPDFVFPVDDRCSDTLASLALYGGLAVYASEEAMSASDDAIGVAGTGILAHIVASVLVAEGRRIARLTDEGPLALGASDRAEYFAGPQATDIWIETDALISDRRIGVRKVIGLGIPLSAVRRGWPRAQLHDAADVGELLRREEHILDLFYDDGQPEWPPWLKPNHIARYLELATARQIFTGSLPEIVEVSTSPDEEGLTEQLERAGSSGHGLTLIRFDDSGSHPDAHLMNLHTKRPSKAVKTVSVVGVGEWPLGMILRQILRDERIALRGGCDRRPEALHLARQALPFEFLTTRYEDLLNDSETDLIIVAPFHGAHAPLAEAALRAGKHCFVEKPPAIDRHQLDRLMDAATTSDRFLYVGYNRRFAPATQILLEHLELEEGPLTANIVVHSVPLTPNHWYFWPSNGNRIISNTCHFIDYVLQLAAPAKPVRVTVRPSTVGRPDENVIIALAFDDGSIGSITYTNRGSDRGPTYYQSYHVMKGDITGSIEDFARLNVYRSGNRVAGWHGSVDVGHRRQMRVLAEALVHDSGPPVALDVAIASAVTVLAADEAARSGESVKVDLSDLLGSNIARTVTSIPDSVQSRASQQAESHSDTSTGEQTPRI